MAVMDQSRMKKGNAAAGGVGGNTGPDMAVRSLALVISEKGK